MGYCQGEVRLRVVLGLTVNVQFCVGFRIQVRLIFRIGSVSGYGSRSRLG